MKTTMIYLGSLILIAAAGSCATGPADKSGESPRERISINSDWRFCRYGSAASADALIYDVRPDVLDRRGIRAVTSRS